MGNNGLIDQTRCFSPAYCLSGPVQCPAEAPVAYKIQHYCSYSVYTRYNRIHWQHSGPSKAAEGGCPSAPCSGASQLYLRRPNQPMLMAPAEAPREAQSTRQSPKVKTEDVEDLEARASKSEIPSNLNWSPQCSSRTKALRSPKRESKHDVRVEARSACRSRNLGFRRYCPL